MSETRSSDIAEIGRKLGHDLFRFRRAMERGALPASVVEGLASAEQRRLPKEPADRFVAKWLQLRLNALRRLRTVDDGVTPDFLRRIDVALCPVTRVTLTHGLLVDSDWSVDRLNNDGGYARNNLAVMSVKANKAKSDRSFDEVLASAQADRTTDGLAPVEWLRMASLMLGPCFVGRGASAPAIPLAAPVAPCAVQPPIQVIQYAFTVGAARLSGKSALIKQFGTVCRNETARRRLVQFAETMYLALKTATPCWDVWLRADVMRSFWAWHETWDRATLGLAGHLAAQRCGGDRVDPQRVTDWNLAQHGYVQ